ncbi:MAG: MFS transporter [Pseudomonadota bacterium]
MASIDHLPADHSRALKNVMVLVAAQAILGSQMTMIFVVGGLAGQQLAPLVCLATLPISMIVFGSMTTAPWLSALMQKRGRKFGFYVGALGGFAGSLLGFLGILSENFWLFLAGSYMTGIYMSAQGFYRFAAADTASEAFRPKAISYVLAGGLLSAFIGPQLVSALSGSSAVASVERFAPVYVAAMVVNVVGMAIFLALDIPKPTIDRQTPYQGRSRRALLTHPAIAVSIICASVSYAIMNLVMTSTPLAVVGCGFGVPDAANVVSAHVIAMFAPSFFTGHLIVRFGVERIVAAGLFFLCLAAVVALSGVELVNFFGALILLGLGWNFGFIGATTMLARSHSKEEMGTVQGLNDAIVFGCVTFASLASGGLMNCAGADPVAGWSAVNFASVPFLVLAGGALMWLTAQRARSV